MSLRNLRPIARLRRGTGSNPSLVEARLLPELVSDLERIDAGRLPPGALVTGAVDLAVVHAAERDDEFVARLAAERTRLRVAKMMGIGWLTAAHEARHLDDSAQVLAVPVPTRRGGVRRWPGRFYPRELPNCSRRLFG